MRFRGFVKMIEVDKINAHWSLNKAVVPLTLDHTYVDWNVMWCYFDTLNTRWFQTKKDNHARSFAIKCLNHLLPTCDWLHKRKSLTYTDDTCKVCSCEKDDMAHLASCNKLQHEWNTVELECVTKMEHLMHLSFPEEECSRTMIKN